MKIILRLLAICCVLGIFVVLPVRCMNAQQMNPDLSYPDVPILMYHFFDEATEPSTISVTPQRFREQLVALKDAGYETITSEDLIGYTKGEGTLPDKPVMVTIDDGYSNNYTKAFPILQELDMKATIFVIVEYRGTTPGSNPHFSWEEAKEMSESGLVSIQSHSFDSHRLVEGTSFSELTGKLAGETAGDYEKRVYGDFVRSKEEIEKHVGKEVTTLAYPYGKSTAQTEEWLKKAGYQMSLSIKRGTYLLGNDLWKLPRVTANGKWTGEELLKEIRSAHSGGAGAPVMYKLDGKWTVLHNHAINKRKVQYVEVNAFSKLLDLPLVVDQATGTITRSTDGAAWQLATGVSNGTSAAPDLNNIRYLQVDGQYYLDIASLSQIAGKQLVETNKKHLTVIDLQ